MPRLPVLSGADIVKALEQLGFTAIRQRGSHVVMRRDEAGTVVSQHRNLTPMRQPDDADAALRPKTLAEFVGQAAAKP